MRDPQEAWEPLNTKYSMRNFGLQTANINDNTSHTAQHICAFNLHECHVEHSAASKIHVQAPTSQAGCNLPSFVLVGTPSAEFSKAQLLELSSFQTMHLERHLVAAQARHIAATFSVFGPRGKPLALLPLNEGPHDAIG